MRARESVRNYVVCFLLMLMGSGLNGYSRSFVRAFARALIRNSSSADERATGAKVDRKPVLAGPFMHITITLTHSRVGCSHIVLD